VDNGPLTAYPLIDWCRFTGADPPTSTRTVAAEPILCESFNGRFRDELRVGDQLNTLLRVHLPTEEWPIPSTTPTGPSAA
jgi:hypothetical protein